ncbi:MAG TPA: hypothetical protein VFB21_18235 [Chthonomonadaceae bacterium]|nr:hypothetical protein [Chthonomonadaceae bacterium]
MNAKIKAILHRQLSGSVVAGILILFAVIMGALAWKFVLAPPAPTPVIAMTREEMQEALQKHDESVALITARQLRAYAEIHKNDPPPTAPTKPEGYSEIVRQNKKNASKKK